MYKLQEQMFDVAGPLTCLWVDLLNKEAHVSAEDTLVNYFNKHWFRLEMPPK